MGKIKETRREGGALRKRGVISQGGLDQVGVLEKERGKYEVIGGKKP